MTIIPKFISDINTNPKVSKTIDYLILHCTTGPVEKVIQTFKDTKNEKTCHYIIDEDGTVYQLLKVSKEEVQIGWHSGRSLLKKADGKIISEFNRFSVGIELINKNGNLYSYSNQLYESLIDLVQHLIKLFPNLSNPNQILGHEHISGFRGKVDPGHMFDWNRLFKGCYHSIDFPIRKPQMPNDFKNLLFDIQHLANKNKISQDKTDDLIRRLMNYYHFSYIDKVTPYLNKS